MIAEREAPALSHIGNAICKALSSLPQGGMDLGYRMSGSKSAQAFNKIQTAVSHSALFALRAFRPRSMR